CAQYAFGIGSRVLSLAFLRQRLDLIGHKADVTGATTPAASPHFLRASSLLSNLAAERRLGSSSK
ncbi:MAG: hypothetical protein WAV38_21415, partial [Xanthobacteraceae bacterium]